MYTIKIDVLDADTNDSVFSAEIGDIDRKDLYVDGSVTPGLDSVGSVITKTLLTNCLPTT
jgi:hypothetical protein